MRLKLSQLNKIIGIVNIDITIPIILFSYKNNTIKIPIIRQYLEKKINFLFFNNLNNNFKEKYVVITLIKKVIKYNNHDACNVFILKKPFNFKIILIILIGMNIRKEKS